MKGIISGIKDKVYVIGKTKIKKKNGEIQMSI
jgi:hypothetical protein